MLSSELENKIIQFFKEKEIQRIYLFGSYLRNQENADSDIDLLVEIKPIISYLKFVKYKRELSEFVGKEIDLVTSNSISPYIFTKIQKEMKLIYERK